MEDRHESKEFKRPLGIKHCSGAKDLKVIDFQAGELRNHPDQLSHFKMQKLRPRVVNEPDQGDTALVMEVRLKPTKFQVPGGKGWADPSPSIQQMFVAHLLCTRCLEHEEK